MPQEEKKIPDPAEPKIIALWLAVGITMAAVVGVWLYVVPSQITDFRLLSSEDVARWEELKFLSPRVSTLKGRLVEIGKKFEDAHSTSSGQAAGQGVITAQDVEKLKLKIEAASEKSEN